MTIIVSLFAALTVVHGATADGCPDAVALGERLRALGIAVSAADDVRVSFAQTRDGHRLAEVTVPGGDPRQLAHDGNDCSALAEATVSVLSVLLDERHHEAVPPSRSTPHREDVPDKRDPPSSVRLEAGTLVATGIVADLAVGTALAIAWRPVSWIALGVSGELWPQREHRVGSGWIGLAAGSGALVFCGGPTIGLARFEGCLLGHGGIYDLSAAGFAVVRSDTRALFGVEGAFRGSIALTKAFGVFLRTGLWLPFTKLDVAVRGADGSFPTTAFGPKVGVGVELNL